LLGSQTYVVVHSFILNQHINSCKPTTSVCGWRYNRVATKLVVAAALMQVAVRELRKYWLKGHNSKVLV
jgi:hypothetical protein